MDDQYKTIETPSTGYFKDKGSKFYSYAYPLKDEEEVKDLIAALKKEHHSARHHCYAWRLGTEEICTRANDDGEPSSTAGKPILGQLQSYEVTNILVVVVRYFGGTLLGVSGLINAYREATVEALNNADILSKLIEIQYELKFEYDMLNTAMNKLKQENYDIVTTDFQESCRLIFKTRKSEDERAFQAFNEIYGIEIKRLD
ncbi:YigZ family protein [Draconibacterium sp. IB214405]|uniref:IMPACT family protein n=1 Tax=Draconibacterium sp. IB214405 TaxID=3097352 RepID=UPI002A16E78A|nr:YigZ family protein [Draconibacterium sp. IB214405]MDX8339434.1 YigZ family protein [Draconibacterium sp. IB214405]